MDVELFFLLIGTHYLVDFGLQTPHMVAMKGKVFIEAAGFHTLTAHAAMHGLFPGLILQSLEAALIVAITHWVIDFGRASELLTDKYPHTKGSRKHGQRVGMYGLNIDQALHISVLLLVTIMYS